MPVSKVADVQAIEQAEEQQDQHKSGLKLEVGATHRQKNYSAIDNRMIIEETGSKADLTDDRLKNGINGISNLGNTCYINATLNCLFKI